MEIEDDLQKEPNQTEGDIVDVEDAEQQRKIRDRAKAVAKVQDASIKWLANLDADTRNMVESTAVQILLSMHATFCYYCGRHETINESSVGPKTWSLLMSVKPL